MIERRNRPRLAFETLRELGLRNLQRDNAIEPRVARLPHLAHPAPAPMGASSS
jgi:hypothetical protein